MHIKKRKKKWKYQFEKDSSARVNLRVICIIRWNDYFRLYAVGICQSFFHFCVRPRAKLVFVATPLHYARIRIQWQTKRVVEIIVSWISSWMTSPTKEDAVANARPAVRRLKIIRDFSIGRVMRDPFNPRHNLHSK